MPSQPRQGFDPPASSTQHMHIFSPDQTLVLTSAGWVHVSEGSSSMWLRFSFDEALDAAQSLGEVIIQGF